MIALPPPSPVARLRAIVTKVDAGTRRLVRDVAGMLETISHSASEVDLADGCLLATSGDQSAFLRHRGGQAIVEVEASRLLRKVVLETPVPSPVTLQHLAGLWQEVARVVPAAIRELPEDAVAEMHDIADALDAWPSLDGGRDAISVEMPAPWRGARCHVSRDYDNLATEPLPAFTRLPNADRPALSAALALVGPVVQLVHAAEGPADRLTLHVAHGFLRRRHPPDGAGRLDAVERMRLHRRIAGVSR